MFFLFVDVDYIEMECKYYDWPVWPKVLKLTAGWNEHFCLYSPQECKHGQCIKEQKHLKENIYDCSEDTKSYFWFYFV